MTSLKSIGIICLCFLFASGGFAQKYANDQRVLFKQGPRTLPMNAADFLPERVPATQHFAGYYFVYLQGKQLWTQDEQQLARELGIKLLEYIPHKTYVAAVPTTLSSARLKRLPLRSVQLIPTSDKIDARLRTKASKHEVSMLFHKNLSVGAVMQALSRLDIQPIHVTNTQMLLRVTSAEIELLAQQPFTRYLDAAPPKGEPESDDGRNLHRSNLINGEHPLSRKYDGSGVNIAINDDGYVGPHIDFHGRVNQNEVAGDFTGDHGDMVAGIAGGAGNLDPQMRGMAPGAYMWIRQYSGTLPNTVNLHQTEQIMVFSSSYGNGCNAGYTALTVQVDQEVYNNPSLIQTFSAGNSNGQNCGYGAGNQWGNITGGHKSGKNVIATANLELDDALRSTSSRGPATDGRIKPDIAAHGHGQMSTDPNNTYAPGGGTSAAAPGIAGVLAQLYQAYRALNGGTNPASGLLKACLLNSANDLGNPGPDYKYGWGKVNAYKALTTIEDNRYLSAQVVQGQTQTHTIQVPSGATQLRVMVYWTDPEGSTTASYNLVNDLDIKLLTPSNNTLFPWILDPTPNSAALDAPATTGRDSLNNMEQVRIDNPAAGTYTLQVEGNVVPQGPQSYFVVYEFNTEAIKVTYPSGGEGLTPNSNERIHWDATDNTGTFTVEFSDDNGLSWSVLSNNVPGNERILDWVVPNTVSGQARVRVSRNGETSMSEYPFSVIEVPENLRVTSICSNTMTVAWDSVPQATQYVVYRLGNQFMDSIGITNALSFDIPVLAGQDTIWFSVAARGANQTRGRRAIAVNNYNNAGLSMGTACYLNCNAPDDAGIAQITNPQLNSIGCAGNIIPVEVQLENLGSNTQTQFEVYYKLDNQAIVVDTFTQMLNPGAQAAFTFDTPLTLSEGMHSLQVWVDLDLDSTYCNDTLTQDFAFYRSISNSTYTEDFSGTFPTAGDYLSNPDNATTWNKSNVVQANGNNGPVMFMNNYSYNAPGEEDSYTLRSFDLTGQILAQFSFDLAHQRYSGTSERLLVLASRDCGRTFTDTLYNKAGAALATTSGQSGQYIPSLASQWRKESIDLSPYLGGTVALRFVHVNAYGNNLFVDNINLTASNGSPLTSFEANNTYICAGDTIQLNDLSTGTPTAWNWSFSPNTVQFINSTSSTSQNPTVVVTDEGLYDVQLITSNATGSDTLLRSGYVNAPLVRPLNVNEPFTGGLPVDWQIENPDGATTWIGRFLNIGPRGAPTRAMMVENFNYVAGEEDGLVSYPIDLTNAQNATLSYAYAHTRANASSDDPLRVEISTDCGRSYQVLRRYVQTNTSNNYHTSSWLPTRAGDWMIDSLSLVNFVGKNVQIRFVNESGASNNTFIDDVRVERRTGTSTQEAAAATPLRIFPNPTQGQLTLEGLAQAPFEVHVFDLQGRLVHTQKLQVQGAFQTQMHLDLPAGLYLLRLTNAQQQYTQRVLLRQ